MVFKYFLIPVVSSYYYRLKSWAVRIHWETFGTTDAPQSVHMLYEPADGEAIAPQ